MKKIIFILIITALNSYTVKAQFDKPQMQVGIGFTIPYDQLKGDYLQNEILGNYYLLTINENFMTNNYGGKNGLNFFGKGKINFDKYSIVRGTFGLTYSSFNTFEAAKSGIIGVEVLNFNNELDTIPTSITYDYNFSNFNIGLGLEIAPTSFTGIFSPYFGANFNFNFFGGELARTENSYDSVVTDFGDFRMGINFDAGFEVTLNKKTSFAFGYRYDLGNLFYKNTNGSLSDAVEYGKSNIPLNDEQGRFYSTIYGPVLSSVRRLVNSSEKKINWGTAYIGVNINLFETDKTKSKKAPPKK